MFLRRQLSEALTEILGTSAYLSSSTGAFNADEPPVNKYLENSELEESAICIDSKKNITKEKS